MDNLQYFKQVRYPHGKECFKPYYKWITFNTEIEVMISDRMFIEF